MTPPARRAAALFFWEAGSWKKQYCLPVRGWALHPVPSVRLWQQRGCWLGLIFLAKSCEIFIYILRHPFLGTPEDHDDAQLVEISFLISEWYHFESFRHG